MYIPLNVSTSRSEKDHEFFKNINRSSCHRSFKFTFSFLSDAFSSQAANLSD